MEKIYEYINLNLPMIGALPNGDAQDIINNLKYGKAYNYSDIVGLAKSIQYYINKDNILVTKKNIKKDKNQWQMKSRIIEVDKLLKALL